MRPATAAAVLLGLAARPSPPDPSTAVLYDAASRQVPAAQGRCRLQVGALAHDLRVWLDGPRMHLAVLGPLGTPQLVLRSDGRGLALQQGPEILLAADADVVLSDVGLPDLQDLAGLWVGRLPDRPRSAVALPDGRAWAGLAVGVPDLALAAVVHPERGVELVDLGPPDGASLASLSRSAAQPSGLPDVVRLHLRDRPVAVATCTWAEGPAPDAAFDLAGSGRVVPMETIGRRLAGPLGMLPQRRPR